MDERTKTETGAIRHNGRSTLPRIVDRVKGADDKLVMFVRDRPIAAMVAALAVGYVLGRIVTRT